MADEPIVVIVTAEDVFGGVAGDCFRCPIACALARATGDAEANVYERDFVIYLQAEGRSIEAPPEAAAFSWKFDARDKGGPPGPFAFTLPPLTDSAWMGNCEDCGHLFPPDELDDEWSCEDCRGESEDDDG